MHVLIEDYDDHHLKAIRLLLIATWRLDDWRYMVDTSWNAACNYVKKKYKRKKKPGGVGPSLEVKKQFMAH